MYLYDVSPMLRFGERAFDGKKIAISSGSSMLRRMVFGWNGGRWGDKNVGGGEQLLLFQGLADAFQM